MKARELLAKLQELVAAGHGDLPVDVMQVEDGVTFAQRITGCDRAHDYDGDRIWLYGGEVQSPEWARKV